jgi:glycosyltransferase involved in cell wall biosynthesis
MGARTERRGSSGNMPTAIPATGAVIRQQNKGACAARNAGLMPRTGEYVQFLDADDLILPDKIAAQVALAEAKGLTRPGGRRFRAGDAQRTAPAGARIVRSPWMALIRTRMGTTSANLWKRRGLMAVGGWNEELASSQDYELMFRLLETRGHRGCGTAHPHAGAQAGDRFHFRTGVLANWERYIALRHAIKEHLEATGPRAL